MKKFSVLFVAMLIALMLFVGCENKPKERPAKEEDMEVFGMLTGAASTLLYSGDKVEGVDITPATPGSNKISVVFTNAEYKKGDLIIILNGTGVIEMQGESGKMKLDLTSGTSINGKGHTLYVEASSSSKVPEIILDGYRLTDLDKLMSHV